MSRGAQPLHSVYDPNTDQWIKVNADGSINISGSISATNPSVGVNGAAAPADSTQVGWKDGSGNLQPVSAATPLPVSGSFSQNETVLNVQGSASAAAVFSNFPLANTQGYRTASVQVTAIAANSTIVVEESNDGVTWTAMKSSGEQGSGSTALTAVGQTSFTFSGLQFRVRQSIYGGSGTSTVNVEFREYPQPHRSVTQGAPGALPWLTEEVATAATDRSGSITAGGTSQQIMAANTSRVEAWVANPDASEAMFINITGGAAVVNGQGSITIPPGQGWSGKVTGAITGIAATTAHKYTAGER